MHGLLDYNVTYKKEILLEVAASVYADFCRYIDGKHIDYDDMTNGITVLTKDVFKSRDVILDCKTLDELRAAEEKLHEWKCLIEYLIENGDTN